MNIKTGALLTALLGVSAVTLPATTAAAQKAAPRAPAASTVVTAKTQAGTVEVGKPSAKHRLIEYISYTCGHCATFASTSSAPLKTGYIDRGKVKVEYRNLVRDPFDFAAALLAHCGTPSQFVRNHDYLLATQKIWMDKVNAATPAQKKSWSEGSFNDRLTRIGADSGLVTLMRQRGLTPAQANSCLTHQTRQDQLLAMTEHGGALGVTGTPSFILNGTLLKVHDWASVKAAIDAAP